MNRCVIHMYGEEGRRLKLVSKIKEYLPVKIDPGDPLPKTICRQCIYRLQCHHTLMRQITLARKRLSKKILERQLVQMESVQERVHVFQREGTPPPNNYNICPESRTIQTSQNESTSSSQLEAEIESANQTIPANTCN
ncbi:hypothetical protein M8J76_003483 [Diaphorina citri]|nr:hypothetical protein M8J75_000787 [Diaphorina citri]KAI5740402.1 hypothetical protein M8J76_003483 [Diaphorina citri]KAI5746899.1 hypothetical protein M8J77_008811 [Diaphorina citri]